ncbi:MAG: SRPBCC family protein, partial [Chloroflexota bacterium]
EQRKDQLRIVVNREDAVAIYECEFSIPPAILWDYITKPEFRKLLMDSDSQTLSGQSGGRIGAGAVYVCAHGEMEVVQKIVDWQPFEQYTITGETNIGKATHNNTYRIESTDQGSRLYCLVGPHTASWIVRYALNFLAQFIQPLMMKKGEIRLREKIEQDLAAKATVVSQKIIFGNEMVKNAAAESLQDNAISGD